MKVLVATPLYPPDIGGPATYAKILLEELPGKGIEVEVVKFSDVRHLLKGVRHLVYFLRIWRALRNADVILALDPVSVGLPACMAARVTRKPLVVKIVGDYAWEQGQQRFGVTQTLDEFLKNTRVSFPVHALRRIEYEVATYAKHLIVPSEYLKKVVQQWGISENKIEVIYNAVPTEEKGHVPPAVAKLPRPLVVTAGRLVPWKNIDGIIDAVANTTGVSLAVLGEGPDRTALVRRAEEKLPERAVFTGPLAHSDMLATLQSADVFILNSSYEGLSHLLIEAQALGIPTIATNVGGNSEVITNGEDGLLLSPGDTLALTHALVNLLGDAPLRARLSLGARASAKRFSSETMIQATADILGKI